MNLTEQILANLEQPRELERLFRQNPDGFRASLPEAMAAAPGAIVLDVWQARLEEFTPAPAARAAGSDNDLRLALLLALLAGLCTRMILYLTTIQKIAPVNLLYGVVPFLAVLFAVAAQPAKKLLAVQIACFLGSWIYLNFLPLELTDSVRMAYLHLPVFLWILAGFSFTGNLFRSSEARLSYLKFNGEFAIVYAILAICGVILTVLTLQLFHLAGMDISQFYMENIVVPGAASLALLAAWLVNRDLKPARTVAPFLARIFSPLVFLTLLAYLTALAWSGKNPFLDRDFLIAFNGILLIVLAITIFSLTENQYGSKKNPADLLNRALISLALLIDGVALASIVFRLSSFGLTPNRAAVLGVNLLTGIHLIRILTASIRSRGQKADPLAIRQAVTGYLPAYGVWATFVILIFPWAFR